MPRARSRNGSSEIENAALPESASDETAPAWEMIEAGRYRPRRIRGSLRGRELG
jgi:hypothetical protein